MNLPFLKATKRKQAQGIIAFRGVNYGEDGADGQMEESRNLFSGRFPCLSPRDGRERGDKYENATAVWYKDGLLVVDGSDLIYNGEVVGAVSPGKKQFANINTKVVIMPDKVVFDTKTRELRGLGAEYTALAGSAVFANSNTESKLTTHIGSYVEGIAGSGNVGGNDALGQKSPIFMLDKPPFTKVYESGSVSEESGGFVLGVERTGDGLQAQNVAVGNVFTAASLGADGTKRIGRITGKTKFPETQHQDNHPIYAWKRHHVTESQVTTTNIEKSSGSYDAAVATPVPNSTVKGLNYTEGGSLYFGTGSTGATINLVFGNSVYIQSTGYYWFGAATSVSYTFSSYLDDNATFTIGPFDFSNGGDYGHANLYVGITDTDGKIRSYIEMPLRNAAPRDEEFSASTYFTLTLRATRAYVETGYDEENDESIGYYEQYAAADLSPSVRPTAAPTYNRVASVAASKGAFDSIVYAGFSNFYPNNGLSGAGSSQYWYVYQGQVTNPCYYGFDYDLIEARDAAGVNGFEAVNFRAGDTVEISGCTSLESNNITATIREITEETVNGVTQHSLVFDSGLFTAGTETSAVTITRKVPNLSVICESQNRLFGAEGNTIYVSALGDPTNMNTYDGVDTDSYSVAVATEGAFTGCIGYGKTVLFFKEDCMHKLMGDYPSEYQLYDYMVPGVLEGSEESLWNLNEVVYYHGREGVYRYNGGAPELISENFGLRRFDTAAAGAAGDRYYISMRDKETGEWGLWVYDAQRDIWLQEDETQAVCFCRDGGKLFYIDGEDSTLVQVNPEKSEEEIEWSATLCRMDEVYHNRKCYSRLLLRADLEEGAWLQVEISHDDGPFEMVYTTHKDNKTAVIPIHPNRCDNFRIRLTGGGKVLVRSLVREFYLQSEH